MTRRAGPQVPSSMRATANGARDFDGSLPPIPPRTTGRKA